MSPPDSAGAENTDAADDTDDSGGPTGAQFNVSDALVIALLTVVAFASFTTLTFSVSTLFAMDLAVIVRTIVPVLLLVPVPAAYIAAISLHGFRKETLAAAVVLPAAVLGYWYAAVAAGIVLGSIMVSYKARSVFNDRNPGWTYFKAAGGMITVFALVLGLAVAQFYVSTPSFRDDLRSEMTAQSVDLAMEHAGVATDQNVISAGQTTALSGMVGPIARNISQGSIDATETLVFTAIQQARQDDPTLFESRERQLLRDSFQTADDQIPGTAADQAETLLQEQVAPEDDQSGYTVEDAVRPKVRELTDQVVTASTEATVLVFFIVFSTVMLVRLPFEFLAALYAPVLRRIRTLLPG